MDLSTLENVSNTEHQILLVDSRFRDKFSDPEPEHFQVMLDTPLTNVVGFEVLDSNIPNTEFAVDVGRDTIVFKFPDDVDDSVRSATMSHGQYDAAVFMDLFNQLATGLQLRLVHDFSSQFVFSSASKFQLDFQASTLRQVLGGNRVVAGSIYSRSPDLDVSEPYVYESQWNPTTSLFEIQCPGLSDFAPVKRIHLSIPELESRLVYHSAQQQFRNAIATFELPTDGFNQTRFDFVNVSYRKIHPIGKLSKFTIRLEHPDRTLYNCKGIDFLIQFAVHRLQPAISHRMNQSFDGKTFPVSSMLGKHAREDDKADTSPPSTYVTKPQIRQGKRDIYYLRDLADVF